MRGLISGCSAGCGHDGPPLFNGMTLMDTDIMDDDCITTTRGALVACAARRCRKPLDERRAMVCCAGRRELACWCCDHLSFGPGWIQFSLRCSSGACAERAMAPNGSRAQYVSMCRAVLRVGARECMCATCCMRKPASRSCEKWSQTSLMCARCIVEFWPPPPRAGCPPLCVVLKRKVDYICCPRFK